MAAQREDYLLRLIAQLREFIADIVRRRQAGRSDEAMEMLWQAQERLFGRPLPEFSSLAPEDQIELLILGEPPALAREKCLLYAALLREAGLTYRAIGAEELAPVALHFALRVLLAAGARVVPQPAPDLREPVETLLADLGPGGLSADWRAAVADFRARMG